MPTIKLTKVNIGPSKNVVTLKDSQGVSTQAVMVVDMDGNIVIPEGSTFVGAATKISFSTLSGELSDNEYATQENGFHWVKIKNYAMTKIAPEYIVGDVLSNEGINEIKKRSVTQ